MKYTHNCDIDINEGGTVHMMNTHTHTWGSISHPTKEKLSFISTSVLMI